ncbi:hypothetical protein KCV87_09915 [Actinosynnema pretiosum subsp. pretiosum]|uniref:RiboL-PSP-HEPN domain-containing protein n=1 Tax=Actinosynnema pretiosum subsp. pretiosum TaxID=103721 RepID=A0AA45LAE9_9PSEU|nr:hypothetical protein KCV87_09915 [Actinosynnema pretiosum subsp. pretiosum]
MASRAPTKTDSFTVFEKNIERARAFLRIFGKGSEGRKQGRPSSDETELLRGSLVFAVGALDAYLSDLILEIVPKYAPKNEKVQDAMASIAKSDPGIVLRVALAKDDESRIREFRNALEIWLESKSFHGPRKVVEALSYVGCVVKWEDFDKETGSKTSTALENATKERHGIVHRGAQPDVKQKNVSDAVTLIENIAKVVDQAVVKRYA